MLQLAVESTNKRVEHYDLMIKCMNDPLLQEHPLIQEARERPTYLKRTQAWPPKSAESLSKVPLTVDELRRFIAIEYYMGMVKVPSMEHYWSPRLLDSQVVKNIMSRGRFNAIKAMLSLESVEDTKEARDNNRHRKVGVWLDMFNERNKTVAQTYWTPEQLQSSTAIDEQSILCKSKMTAESQRMPNKPVKQGYKIFSINDSKIGYTYSFSCAMRTSSMTIHDRVLELVKGLPEGCRGSDIYMDNLFTTPDVLLELKKMDHGGAGTWRRQVPPPFAAGGKGIGKANWGKVPERGDCIGYVSEDGLTAYLWHDSKPLNILSTIHGPEVDCVVQRRMRGVSGRTTYQAPRAATDYNMYMLATDKFDQMRGAYNVQKRAVKPWFPLYYWILDAAAVNAWCLYQKFWEQENPGMTFKDDGDMQRDEFQIQLFESLAGRNTRKRPAIHRRDSYDGDTLICPFVETVEIDPNRAHYTKIMRKRGRCAWCKIDKSADLQTTKACDNCVRPRTRNPIYLHPKCMRPFHEKQAKKPRA
mmetsp:Transcript_13890/g.56311  ORF Transcript_13890/g.56311 Transcript_13890/m.56311 type:complete len:529 (+) Transcript_13890:4546-6132(+)